MISSNSVSCAFSGDLHLMELTDKRSGEVFRLKQPFESSIASIRMDGRWEGLRPIRREDADGAVTARLASPNARGEFRAHGDDRGITLSLNAATADGRQIQELAWTVGFDPKGLSFLFPARGGVLLDEEIPVAEQVDFNYPMNLDAQFCIVQGRRSVLRIATFEPASPFHRIRIRRDRDDLTTIRFGLEPRAPFPGSVQGPVYRIESFPAWQEAVKDYKEWMEKQFHPIRLTDRPQWFRDLKLVVMCICGRSVYEPEVELHNYDDLMRMVDMLERYDAPKTTLIYICGALLEIYDGGLPDYRPQDLQGGEKKFKQFLEHAHARGFKVMGETNPIGLDYSHPLYEKFRDCTMSDAYATPFSRGYHDYEGDQPKDFFAYIRPNCAGWRQVIVDIHKRITGSFPLDMILLDQHYYHLNDPGCDFDTAVPVMYKEVAEASLPALLAGESCHERSVATDVPLSVISCDIYNSHRRPAWTKLHPICVTLFRDYVMFCGHEGTLPSPGHRHTTGWPSDARLAETGWTFKDQQERHRFLNLVPTIRMTPRYGEIDEATATIIREAADFKWAGGT